MKFLEKLLAILSNVAQPRFWALLGAGMVVTGVGLLLTFLVYFGWNPAHQSQQLQFLGWGLIISLIIIGVIVVALAGVIFKGTGFGGASIEITSVQGDTTKVTHTTEVTTPKVDG